MIAFTRNGPREPSPRGPAAPGALAHDERDAMAVLVSVEGLGPVTLARLLDRLGTARAILELAREGATAVPALMAATDETTGGRRMTAAVARGLLEAAAAELTIRADIQAAGLTVVALGDAAYPGRLRGIAAPPHVLFVRGDVAALSAERCVAVVGTRRPTSAGRWTATRIGAALARAGAAVVSGLAVGVDGAAHSAVVAEGGRTVAVIAGGHRRLFPTAHRALAESIVAAGGAVVSEHAPGSVPTRGTFPRRNRIISGLAEAVIVVEAGARSGALTTAAWALEQGRGCHLVPGSIDAPMSAGCLAFLRECTGEAQIVAGIPQLLEDLRLAVPLARTSISARSSHATTPPGNARPLPASADAVLVEVGGAVRRVAEAILAGYQTADELVAVCSLPIAAVLASLTVLETRGLVSGAYGRYRPTGALARVGPPTPDSAVADGRATLSAP